MNIIEKAKELLRNQLGRDECTNKQHIFNAHGFCQWCGTERRELYLRDLARHVLAQPESPWRPISEAPKDGTEVLVGFQVRSKFIRRVAYWASHRSRWLEIPGCTVCHPEWWTPLPPAPEQGAKTEGGR